MSIPQFIFGFPPIYFSVWGIRGYYCFNFGKLEVDRSVLVSLRPAYDLGGGPKKLDSMISSESAKI
jgi:hypothetical protein